MGQQAAAASGQRSDLLGRGAGGWFGQQRDDGLGDGGRRVVDGGQQRQDGVGRVAGSERVDSELEHGRAGHAVPVGRTAFDETDGEQLVEPVGDERGKQPPELIERGRCARFVEVDELVGFEPEDVAEIGPVAPQAEQVSDSGEGVAAILEPGDELEAGDVGCPIDADAAPALRGGHDPHGLVFANRADRDLRAACELIDGQLHEVDGQAGRCGSDHGWTVTVNTVTVNTVTKVETDQTLDADLLAVLRTATSTPTLAFADAPTRLTGGFWAELISFRLRDAPPAWSGGLVARVMPDPGIAAKETAIQSEVAAQGFPTPTVHLAGGPDAGLGRSFLVMDLAAGGSMLGGLGGAGAVAALPRLARRLPDTLAKTMARLHQVDVAPVRQRLVAAGITASTVGEVVRSLTAGASLTGRADLEAAGRWLAEHAPAVAPEVVCHGDLHPFNLLVDREGEVTVLDWSAGLLAPQAYDVAFTGLVLAEPPVSVPRVLRPLVRAAGRALARRFRSTYARETGAPIDPASLEWHEGVICLRALVEVAGWAAAGRLDHRTGHPWLVAGPAFAARLTALTGAPVTAR